MISFNYIPLSERDTFSTMQVSADSNNTTFFLGANPSTTFRLADYPGVTLAYDYDALIVVEGDATHSPLLITHGKVIEISGGSDYDSLLSALNSKADASVVEQILNLLENFEVQGNKILLVDDVTDLPEDVAEGDIIVEKQGERIEKNRSSYLNTITSDAYEQNELKFYCLDNNGDYVDYYAGFQTGVTITDIDLYNVYYTTERYPSEAETMVFKIYSQYQLQGGFDIYCDNASEYSDIGNEDYVKTIKNCQWDSSVRHNSNSYEYTISVDHLASILSENEIDVEVTCAYVCLKYSSDCFIFDEHLQFAEPDTFGIGASSEGLSYYKPYIYSYQSTYTFTTYLKTETVSPRFLTYSDYSYITSNYARTSSVNSELNKKPNKHLVLGVGNFPSGNDVLYCDIAVLYPIPRKTHDLLLYTCNDVSSFEWVDEDHTVVRNSYPETYDSSINNRRSILNSYSTADYMLVESKLKIDTYFKIVVRNNANPNYVNYRSWEYCNYDSDNDIWIACIKKTDILLHCGLPNPTYIAIYPEFDSMSFEESLETIDDIDVAYTLYSTGVDWSGDIWIHNARKWVELAQKKDIESIDPEQFYTPAFEVFDTQSDVEDANESGNIHEGDGVVTRYTQSSGQIELPLMGHNSNMLDADTEYLYYDTSGVANGDDTNVLGVAVDCFDISGYCGSDSVTVTVTSPYEIVDTYLVLMNNSEIINQDTVWDDVSEESGIYTATFTLNLSGAEGTTLYIAPLLGENDFVITSGQYAKVLNQKSYIWHATTNGTLAIPDLKAYVYVDLLKQIAFQEDVNLLSEDLQQVENGPWKVVSQDLSGGQYNVVPVFEQGETINDGGYESGYDNYFEVIIDSDKGNGIYDFRNFATDDNDNPLSNFIMVTIDSASNYEQTIYIPAGTMLSITEGDSPILYVNEIPTDFTDKDTIMCVLNNTVVFAQIDTQQV